MSHNITVEGGKSVRLPTAGKYCDRDIVITATGGGVVVCTADEPDATQVLNSIEGLKVSFPSAQSLDNCPLKECTSLIAVDIANDVPIGYRAFYNCTALISANLPKITRLEMYEFEGCTSLTNVNMPSVISLAGTFQGCTSLATIDLPNVVDVGGSTFGNCYALTSVRFPHARGIGLYAFADCKALTSISFPNVEYVDVNAFDGCTALTSVDLPVATSIGSHAFNGCTNLSTLILRTTESVCQLIVTAVLGTKIATADGVPTGEGFIYVPAALYEGYVELIAYQAEQLTGDTATAEYIARAVLRKIEDYPEICGY